MTACPASCLGGAVGAFVVVFVNVGAVGGSFEGVALDRLDRRDYVSIVGVGDFTGLLCEAVGNTIHGRVILRRGF